MGTLRAGTSVSIVVDVTLSEIWFAAPTPGSKIPSVDGRSGSGAVCYETRGPETLVAPFDGSLRVEDTRIDVHTPQGFPDAGSGEGVAVTLRHESGLELRFAHLQRGSTPSANRVRAGDAIGRTGNTGRCTDGCGRSVVSVKFKAGGGKRLDDYSQPLKIRATLGDKQLTKPALAVPAGVTQVSRLMLGSAKPERNPGKKTTPLKIELVRGTGAQSVAVFETELRVDL
jgi:hypothetical protein